MIPPKYSVKKALIIKDGQVIYDGTRHALGVVCHSLPFKGKVDLDRLKQHLWFDQRFEVAIPYHFRYSYRPWDRDWGFCVPKTLYDSLEEGDYEIELEIEEGEPELKVLDFHIQGKSDLEFVFVAHLDHPGMANDDLAGCAVGVELFKYLSEKKHNKFSYRLLLVQEIIGTQFYLNKFGKENILEGIFLEMLGVSSPLVIQKSFHGKSLIEKNIVNSLINMKVKFKVVEFRKSAKNDEIVFESYGIPMPSIARHPYNEYHSSFDNIKIINKKILSESLALLIDTVDKIDSDYLIVKEYSGFFCLSNPKFDLYIDIGQKAFGDCQMNHLKEIMEYVSIIDKSEFLSIICDKFQLNINIVLEYLKNWEMKGLLRII